MSRWLVLVNPHAGRGRTALVRAEAALGQREIEADFAVVDGIGSLRDTVGEAFADDRDRFVAVGGDGSVNAVVNVNRDGMWDPNAQVRTGTIVVDDDIRRLKVLDGGPWLQGGLRLAFMGGRQAPAFPRKPLKGAG